jgi:autotransporter-associated beta strand protein
VSSCGAITVQISVEQSHTYGGAITLVTNAVRINSDSGTLTLNKSTTAITATNIGLTIGGSGNTTVSTIIATGSGTLTKDGAGTLILSGNNSYTGLTTISAGTLKLGGAGSGSNSPLGTIGSGTVVESGAALDLAGFNLVTTEALTVSGTGVSTSGALFNSSATASTYLGAITLAADTTIKTTGDLTLSSTVDGAFALTVTNTGTVGFRSRVGSSGARLASISVSGPVNLSSDVWTTGAQTYSGNVSISDEISLNSSSGGVTIGGTLTGIQIGSTLLYETTTANRSVNSIVYSTNNSGSYSGAITRITYRMEVTVSGTPYWAEVSFDPWANNLTASDLRIPDLSNNIVVQKIVNNMTVKSNATSSIGGRTSAVITGSGFTGYLELWPWNYGTEAGAPAGVPTGNTAKYDFNDTHSGNGTYGAFQVHNITSGSTQTVFAWNNHASGQSPDIGFGNYTGTVGNASGQTDWTFTGSNSVSLGTTSFKVQVRVNERNPGLTINGGTGAVNITGAVSGLNALTVNSSAATSTVTGAISDASGSATSLTKQGTGTLVLNGANSYTGATTISAGTLKLGHATALGTAAAGTTVASGAVLDLNGKNISNEEALTISGTGISSGGALINSSATGATYAGLLTLAANSSIVGETGTIALRNAGTITGTYDLTLGGAQGGSITSIIGTSTGSVTKVDAGTWTLAGLNTYTGGTSINAGILKAGSAKPFGAASGAVTITSGAVLDLNGQTFTNANALTINGMGISTSGALTNSSATTGVYAGSITLGSTSAIGGTGGTISVTGAVSDSANDYGLVFIGNKAISLSSTSNALRTIASDAGIGALTIVNTGELTIGSISTYNGIDAVGAINIRTTGDLIISKNVVTTNASTTASAPAILLASGSGDAAGTTTNNILLRNSSTITAGTGGIIDLYTGGLTESATLKTYVEAQTTNSAAYNSTLTTQPTTAGYNIIYRGFPPYIYVTIVDSQTGTYGTASGLSYWYSTSASSYGSSYIPALLSSFTTAQTFTAGQSSITINTGGITGTIGISTTLSSTLNSNTYSLTLNPTLALSGAPGVSFLAGDAKSFVVNRKTVELSATKTYDSNTSLTNYVTVTTGVGTQTLTYTGATANDANVATANKYINAITLADGTNGGLASNYQLPTLNRANAPVTINAKTVTLSAEKTYDGSTSLTNYVTVATGIGSQTLTYTGAAANDANVATADKYISAITLANGTNGGVATNYQLPTLDRANAPVTINAKTVTLSAEKTYDGSTSLTNYVTVATGIGSQTLTYTGAAANDANVATADKYINAITLANGSNGGVATNYQLPILNRTNAPVTINTKTVTLSAEKTYDGGTSLTGKVTVSTGVGSETLTYTGATVNNANVATANKFINAITLANGSNGGLATNYQLPGLTAASAGINTVSINKATLTVTADDKSRVYGDSNPSLTYTIAGYVNSENATLASITGAPTISTTATAASNVNTYTITSVANNLGAANYQFSYVDGTLTINRRPVTVTADNKTRVYGDANPALTFAVAADGTGTSRGMYNSQTLTGAVATTAVATTNVGNVSITQGTVTNANNANYDITYNNGTLSITAAELTYNATAAISIYGSTPSVNAGTVTGWKNSETASTATTGTLLFSTSANGTSNIGSYAINGSGLSANHGNYTFAQAAGNSTALIINQKSLTITSDARSTTYGTALVLGTSNYTSSGLINTDSLSGVTLKQATNTTVPATQAAGTYSGATDGILASAAQGTGLSNYSITYVAGTLTIDRKALTVTANNDSKTYGDVKTYGSGLTAFTSSGLVNSETIGSVTITDTNSGGVNTAAAGGSYALTPSLATGGTFSTANYNITYTAGALTVNKATLTVTADDKTRVYGDANPALSHTITGYVNSQDATSAGITGAPTISTTATATSNVNTYTITSAANNLAAANYEFTYTNGTLTVNRRPVTVTADDKVRVYGDANPALTFAVAADGTGTSRGMYNSQTLTGVVTTAATAATNVGTAAITQNTVTNANNSNYAITFVDGTLTINRRPVTVTADNKTRVYGDANPALTFAVAADGTGTSRGMYNSQTLSGAVTTTAGSSTNVGDVSITQGTVTNANNANYDITYNNGTLAITARPITLTATDRTKVYGDALTLGTSAFTKTAGTYANSEVATAMTLTSANGYAASTTRVVGTNSNEVVPTTATGTDGFLASNYDITYVSGSLAITARPITLTATDRTKVYGDALTLGTSAFTKTAGTYANSEVATAMTLTSANGYAASTTRVVGTNSNEVVPTTATGTDGFLASNYDITYVSGSLAITARPITLTATDRTKVYGDALTLGTSAFTKTAGTYANSEVATAMTLTSANGYAASTTRVVGTNSNEVVPTTATGTDGFLASNYDITYVSGSLAITARPITLTATDRTKVYGDALTLGTSAFTKTAGTYANSEVATAMTLTSANGYAASTTRVVGTNSNEVVPTTATGTDGFLASNYDITYVSGSLAVTQKSLTITSDARSTTYGTALVLGTSNYTSSGLINTDSLSGVTLKQATNTTVPATQAAGTYSGATDGILASAAQGTGLSNYSITYVAGTLTIDRKALTVTANNDSKTYGDVKTYGSGLTAFTSSGLVNSETIGSVTITDTNSGGVNTAAAGGSYALTPSLATGGTFSTANYNITYTAGALTINQKSLTITSDARSTTYGTALVLGTSNYTSSGLINTDSLSGVTLKQATNTTVPATQAAGTYSGATDGILASAAQGTGLSNYSITYVAGTLTIDRKALTVTANNDSKTYGDVKTYGSGLTTFTSSGLVNSETIGSVTITDTNSGGVNTAAAGGSYALTPSLATGGTFSTANYNITYTAGALTVNKATLTVTADDKTRVYGDANPALSHTITGYVNSQDATSAGITGAPTISTTATAASNVNTYTITSAANNLAAANYEFTYTNGTLTVNRRLVTVTADSGQAKVYGESNPGLTYVVEGSATGRGIVSGDTLSGALVRASGENVGSTYAINQGTLNNSNYDITYTSSNFAITPRPISFAATAVSKTYGNSDPSLSISIVSGSLATDSVTDSLADVTGTLSRAAGNNAGTYAIALGAGVKASNYAITYTPDVLTINKARLTAIGSKVYNGEIEFEAANLAVTGISGETFRVIGNATMQTKNIQVNQRLANVNGLTISSNGSGLLSNYESLATTDTQVTVTVKNITLTSPILNKTYDGGYTYNMTSADLTAMSQNLVGGDRVVGATVTFADSVVGGVTQVNTGKNAGTGKSVNLSAVVISDGNDGNNYNYTLANTTNNIISPAALNIAAVNDAKFVTKTDAQGYANNCGSGVVCTGNYSGAVINGFVAGETTSNLSGSLSITRTNSGTESAGTYTGVLQPSGFTSNNYNINYVNGDYTIVAAQNLLIKVNPASTQYGNNPTYTMTAQYMSAGSSVINSLIPIDNGIITINDGAGGSANFVISASNPVYSTSGKLIVGGYSLVPTARTLTGGNFLAMTLTGSLTVTPKTLSVTDLGISGITKVYDGGTNISGLTLNVNSAQSQVRTGDIVTIAGTGTYADRNVGTNKNIDIYIGLTGNDAGNYALSSNRIQSSTTGIYGAISQLTSVDWVGSTTGGRWSNAGNWANGALPDASNVGTVRIASGNAVIFDSALVGQVNSAIVNNGVIAFNGANDFNFNSTVSGSGSITQSNVGVLTISGNNSFTGGVSIGNSRVILGHANALGSGSLISNGGYLSVQSDITLTGNLNVNGDINLLSNISSTGNLTFNGDLVSSRNITSNGAVVVAGNTNLSASLAATGNLTFNGDLVSSRSITSNGAITVGGNTNLSASLAALGNLTFNGDLNSSEAITTGGNLVVAGNTNLSASLAATGNLTFNGNLVASRSITSNGAITVGGDANLSASVTSYGNQTYNGKMIVADGVSTLIDILSVDINKNIIVLGQESAKILNLTSTNGNITFNGLVQAASNTLNDKLSLAVDARNGVVINQTIGGNVNGIISRGSYLTNRFGPSGNYVYDLKINAATGYETATIAINADVITAGSQTYGSPVVVGDNGTNGFVRSLVSLDPAITFKSTIDDSIVGMHTLIAKAIANDESSPKPLIDYQNKVGSSKALNDLETITGVRAVTDVNNGQANVDTRESNRFGTVFIRDDVSTVGNQTYLSDSAVIGRSGATDQVIRFTSNGGDVVFDLGSNPSSGVFAASSDLNAQFKLSGGSLTGQELFTTAGIGVVMINNPALSDINYLKDLNRLLSDDRSSMSYDEMVVGEVDIGDMQDAGDIEKCDPKVVDNCEVSL